MIVCYLLHWILVLFLSLTGHAQESLNFLCDDFANSGNRGVKNEYVSCTAARKLKILVVEYGFVDAMTGAANRHLGLLTVLGSLGHTIKRASLRVGMTKKLPPLAKGVFEGMSIDQHPKRLLNFRTGSTDEYVSLLNEYDPDLVILTLWFCGPTLNATTPGYLLRRHRQEGFRAKVVVESSDVHSLREEHLAPFYNFRRTPQKQSEHIKIMQLEESRLYAEADGVWSISDTDKWNMLSLTTKYGYKGGSVNQSKFSVLRYIGSPWDRYKNHRESNEGNADNLMYKPFSERSGIVFVGPGNVPTNVAAIDWFLKAIWPSITEALPDLKFSIIGAWKTGKGKNVAEVYTAVIREAMTCKRYNVDFSGKCKIYRNIQWTGRLSQKDLEKSLELSRIFVSPIQFSTGVNTKNLLALERSLPLITSVNGSSGLCPHDACRTWKDGIPYLVADNQSHFSDLVIDLYRNEELWANLAIAGKTYSTSALSIAGGALDADRSLQSMGLFGSLDLRGRTQELNVL